MGESTLKVPAKYAERFRYETLFAFGTAGEQIEAAYTWTQRAKERHDRPPREVAPDELDRLHEAERIYLQSREQGKGDLVIEAEAKTLVSATLGCALDAVGDLQGALEDLDGDYRSAADEVEFWQDHHERLASLNGKVA